VKLQIVPVTPDRWPDVVALLSSGRSAGACWCQWFRQAPAAFDEATVDERRAALGDRIRSGSPPGLLALESDVPVGWVSLGKIDEFSPRLSRWSVAKGTYDPGSWLINCLYVPAGRRRGGISRRLVAAAAEAAEAGGASAVYAFPLPAAAGTRPEGATGVGYLEAFLATGFEIVPGPLESRPWVVRRAPRSG